MIKAIHMSFEYVRVFVFFSAKKYKTEIRGFTEEVQNIRRGKQVLPLLSNLESMI